MIEIIIPMLLISAILIVAFSPLWYPLFETSVFNYSQNKRLSISLETEAEIMLMSNSYKEVKSFIIYNSTTLKSKTKAKLMAHLKYLDSVRIVNE